MNYNFVIINLASFASYPVKMPNPPDLSRLFVAKVQFCLAYGTDPPRLIFCGEMVESGATDRSTGPADQTPKPRYNT
jgi:hypothetical protein